MGMAICIIVGTTKYWGIFILDWRQYFISKRSLPTSWLKAGRQLILVLTAAAVFLEKGLTRDCGQNAFRCQNIYPIVFLLIIFWLVFLFSIMFFAFCLWSNLLAYV